MFSHELPTYKRDFDMVGGYTRQMAFALTLLDPSLTNEEAIRFVEDYAVTPTNFDEVTIKFTASKNNGDREIKEVPILDYLRRIYDGKLGMAPTLTTYLRPDQKVSLIVESIQAGMGERKIVKREGQLAGLAGDSVTAVIKNGRQNAIKRMINSWSGAALDKHNTFHTPSSHPALTSFCRMSTGLATASVEKFAAGKRYYHTPEKVIEDILLVCTTIDTKAVLATQRRYKLHIPSIDEVMEVISRSTNYYWWDAGQSDYIRRMVSKLTPAQAIAFVYDGDLYHTFKYNYEFIHTMLTRMSTTVDLAQPEESRLGELEGDVTTLVANLIGGEIAGEPLRDFLDGKKYPKGNPIELLADRVLNNLLNNLEEYRQFIETFLRINHYPLNVGNQCNAIRLTVPLGDTDSTIFTTKHINELYYGESTFNEDQEPVGDVIVHMVNGIIAHALGQLTAQLGIVDERRRLIIMKNEFKFPALQLTPVAKTYHAFVKAEEGLVYGKPKFERKGARNHAGRTNQDIMAELHQFMDNSLTNLNKGIKIDRGELIDIMYRIELDIEASLGRKDNVYFESIRIKDAPEYKNANSAVYTQYTLWNRLFGKKYGKAPDPTYFAYKVPISCSKAEFMSWLEGIPNGVREFEAWRNTHEKSPTSIPTFIAVPKEVHLKHGLPSEIIPIVNRHKIISFTCDCHKLNLQSMNVYLDYTDNNRILSDMFIED